MKLPHTQPREYYGDGSLASRPSPSYKSLQTKPDVDFVELLARSNFSFLQGASHPEEMAIQAQKLGYKGLGLCDLNGLYGVVRAFQAVEYPSQFLLEETLSEKMRYHVGAELWVNSRSEKQKVFSLALLPMNKEGYFHLCRIITLSKRRSPKGFAALTLEDLRQGGHEWIALPLPPWNEKDLEALVEIFGSQLYLPVHKDRTWESFEFYQQALALEKKFQVPIVATNRPLMHARERKPLLDVLTCILHQTTLKEAKTRLTANAERYLKPLHELKTLWSDYPEALSRTCTLSDRLRFSLHELQYEYPQAVEGNKDPSLVLRALTEAGLQKRFPTGIPKEVLQQTEHELSLIKELKYEDYFLTLWDVCRFAKSKGILHQGRGSAANSVVCYALELTAVNPTKVKLVFERFISKERGEPPDIDIDFESDRREEVIQYIYAKYGSEHAAMVCTVICYRSRMALRDCAKVLGLPLEKINALSKQLGREGLSHLQTNMELSEQAGIPEKTYRLLLQTAAALVGFPRHLGIHTGGFLISRRPIFECVPVEQATMENRYVIQWNKDDLIVLKMLKIDVLGLGMLGALRRCFELLKSHSHLDYDLSSFQTEDPKTYRMIQEADTVGVFQIESRAQMSLLPRLRPKKFYDLVVQVAIVRPGPLQGGMVHPYIRRRHGWEKVEYAHPSLRPILEKTEGIPIFQEQVIQVAVSVGGFTPGEADELRRIMSSSWKKKDLMHGMKTRLVNGMLGNGISLKYAEQIYQTIVGFSAYGFPESHAASFALLTYTSCFLKCHHPDAFVCALLNAQPMGFYSPRALIADAQRHGVKFLSVDLQKSHWDYNLEQRGEVRVGLRSLYGLNHDAAEKILKEREENGPFKDLTDLVKRTQPSRRALLLLAAAGAFQSFGLTPREALWKAQSLQLEPQHLFFSHSFSEVKDEHLLPKENDGDLIQREYHSKGFCLHKHPLDLFRKDLLEEKERYVTAKDLKNIPGGRKIAIAGLMALHQRPPTAKGFSFLTMEDETGSFNVVLTPPVYTKHRSEVIFHPLLKIHGVLEKKGGVTNVKATRLEPILS